MRRVVAPRLRRSQLVMVIRRAAAQSVEFRLRAHSRAAPSMARPSREHGAMRLIPDLLIPDP